MAAKLLLLGGWKRLCACCTTGLFFSPCAPKSTLHYITTHELLLYYASITNLCVLLCLFVTAQLTALAMA